MILERQLNSAKSVILVLLMLSMSLSAGIVEINRVPMLDAQDVSAVGASCSSITRDSGTPIFVDSGNGSDEWEGTWSCPKASLSDALNDSVSDDEIILYSGRYHENVTVDNKDNLLIRAADDARVVFDGTKSITGELDGVWGAADSDGIQEVTLSEDGWQLFLAYEEQVPARWPNAQFSDETVFNRSYWAEGTLTGSNNAYTNGWLTDAGPETSVHSGLNETINATGLNPVGAIAVMNLGSFRTNSRVITDWNSANGTFAYDGTGVGWKTKHHAYFLEGKRELIDADGEWWFDNPNNKLHYKTPSGQDANNLDLRVKVQPFAIGVENSDGVTIQGIDFFGTTVNFNECDGCSITNSTLEYPSTSKRGLGIAGESEDDRWMTRFYRSTNSFVDNISITNTDGGAIEFQGSAGQSHNNTVNNSYFHAIDWSAADQKGLMVTIYEGGRDMYFTNNTVHLTGASSVLSIGDAPKVFYNQVWDVGHLQTDGAVVQIMQAEAPGAEIAYNWIHDVIKYGARFDAPIGEAGEGRNGTMHHNVIWNAAGGLMVKGDYHNIHNNTVFNSSASKNDLIILTDNDVNNGNSTIHQNAADKMADHRSDSWSLYPLPSGTYWDNWNGYVNTTDTVSNQLVDPINFDFRPNTNSHLDNMSAGAYDADDTDPWTAGVSWTYSPMSDPISGCMDSIAINYNSNAIFADGSCTYTIISSSSSTLSLEVGVTMTPHTFDYSTPFLADDKQTAASSGDVGVGTHVALDSNGAVHICSKIAGSTNDLSYTTNASGSWQSASIDSTGDVGSECFIALDSNDDIHIIYRDTTNTDLKYATKTLAASILASNWDLSAADNNGHVGNFGSLAIDSQDRLHIAYFSGTDTELKYGTKASDSSTWSNEVVDTDENVGKYTSIQVDSNDKPHITYSDHTNTEMKYAHKMGASWTVSTLDSTTSSGSGTSLAIDSNDHLHVAYKTNSTEMAYMTNQSGSWVKTTLDANSSGSWGVNYVDIMISDGDIPHVVYYDAVDHDIFYMSNARGVWERILVAGDSISKTPSSTMDVNGDLHIAYYIDGSFDDMGYAAVRSLAHRPQFEIEPDLPNGVFLGVENGTIYGTPSVFTELTQYTVWANTTRTSAFTTFSMNVDWELMSSVDYLETPRNTAITPITFNWTAWSSGVVNSTSSVYTNGDSAWYNSIVIDSNDKAHIVFYRDDNSNLMYSTNKSGSWATSTIETSNNVGKYCNLAIDSSNGLHVSYQYNSGNALRYAYKSASSSSWSTTTIDSTGGKFTSIAIDSNDKPHIAYRDSGGDLGYAEKTGSSWNSGTVQNAGDIAYTSIALDSDDHIHIAYYDSNNKDMFHLTNTSGSWIKSNLEDIGSLTGGTSLDIAIDPTTDEPGISYFYVDATSLKYTYYTGSSWSATTVENGADYGRFNSIAYDSLGNVHISHERNSADDLYYTSDKTGSWVTTLVHATGSTGTHTSIAVDGNDDIHIAYRYNTGADLYHATVQGYKTGAVTRADVSGATCSISPSLPFGLTLNQGTCTISGTPTSDGSNTTYNLTATSSTGVSKSGEFKLWVTPIAPSIAYSGSPFTFTENTAITSITPSNTGDSAFWSVSPSLPSGLSLSSSGVISGTPAALVSATDYTITATNPGGTSSATISITVNAEIPSELSYATENMTLEKGTLMTTNTATVGGGTVTSWEISPSVPSGLSFSSSSGSISGTPSVLQTTAVTYTIYANNSGGSTSANVNITINDAAPSISYSNNDITGTKNVAISPSIDPTTSGGTITSWEISPSPGSAFQFNSANGQISGTPSILLSRTQYTIWGNNSGGHSVAYVNVTINDVSPNTIVYSSHDLTLEKGTAMTTTTPAISGGSVTSWEISPSIPAGMTFSASTGAISGTPTGLQTTAVAYTIWANNSGGWTSTEMNITINDQAASITYPATVEVSNDRAMTTVTPTNTGGAVPTWEIHPSLPSSLNFGSSNGSIWGTPTGLVANATYTVYANNSGGSPSTTFILGINWTLTPSAEGAYITRNSSIGTDITWEWDYDPLEAQNLSLVTGEWNTCALDNNGNVFCWGRNGNGQIGNGQTGTAGCGSSGHKCKDTPTATNDLGSDVISLAFGHQHACGLLDTGVVKCWGRNNNGQLGTNSGDKDTPQTINLGSGRTATSIYAGGHYTCAILDDASVKCWGQNDQGQLGIGSFSNTNTPTTINTLGSGRTAVSLATAYNAVCALLDDGSVKCWGDDYKGQLGNGGSNSDITSPPASAINLGTGRTAKAITGGEFHFCAILDDDSIKCWGEGDDGKLGTGSTGIRNTPTSTSGSFASGRYAVAIDAGYDHTCAILDNGQLTCWGSDADGQLGNGATTGTKSSLQSSTVSLGTGRTAISLSAGGEHTCAQLDNGQLKCWGNRADGQVGDNGNFNNPSDRTSPSSVSSNNHGGSTYLNTGVMPSSAVTGATCAISPSLPTGLSLTAGTCTITGTPTATATNATYTIWANVSGQSFSGQIWLEVGLNAPDISYSSSSYVYTKDIEITTLTPSNVGGEVTTWAINATLPSGLTFETSNGTIWGTPDTITSATTYTIWANNSADSDSLTITFTVNDQAASIAYPSIVEVSNDRTMTTVTPTNTGGAVPTWEIHPSLPSSLNFGSTNGSIWGTPTGLLANATYTVYANNSGGSSSATFTLGLNWTLTPSAEGAYITRNSSIGSDITFQYYNASRASFVYANTMMSTAFHTCAILDNGDLKCWGQDTSGQLGDGGSNSDLNAPPSTALNLGTGRMAVAVSAGSAHTCVILDNGDVKCWGNDGYGQLGNGPASSTYDSSTASVVNLGTGRTAVAVSAGYEHTCAILDNGDAKCWGSYLSGRLGDGGSATSNVNAPSSTPINLGTGRTAVDISTGQKHTCAVLDNGSIACWGSNHFGQLGHGGSTGISSSTSSPVITNSLGAGRTAVAVSAGTDHTCALLDNGEVKCWGRDSSGQLGDGGSTNTDTNAPPSSAINLGTGRTAVSISAGQYYTCAILDNGDAKCWGRDTNGQLGDGGSTNSDTNAPSSTPINLGTGRTAVALAAGHRHTCAILDNGVAKCWGADFDGQLGNGGFITNNYAASPVSVTGSNTWDSSTGVNTGMFSVSGATCAISPSLPTGMSLTTGPCTVTGTPTVTAVNATYTVWANFSGTSYSGQIYLEVGLNAPDISYSSSTYTYTKDVEITSLNPTNVGGEVTTWAINATLPSGLTFETSNGTIWGTPDTITAATTYTIWANNSADSDSLTITFTVNAATPNFYYGAASGSGAHTLVLYLNQTMNSLTPNHASGGGAITSCSSSPSLPSGLSLNSACVLSGTPDATAAGAFYTITGTNTGGSDTASLYIEVRSYGGALTITPTSTEGSVNSSISDITMSYTHQISNYGWTSGVSNTSAALNSGTRYGIDTAIAPNGDIVAVTQLSVSGNYIFDMHVKSNVNGTWSRIFLDNTSNSGYNPSVEVDENGVVHAIYFAGSTNQLRYVTNLSGSWVSSNLSAAKGLSADWFGTDMAIDSQGSIHFIFTSSNQGSSQGILYHYTNQGGSWTNTTISDASYQDAHYPSMALSGKGAVHIAFYNDDGGDLVHATNENGSWAMENVSISGNIGKWASIALNSNDDVVIASRYSNRIDVSTRTGSSGTWSTANTGTGNRYPMYMDMKIDSNDDVHIVYRCSGTWAQVGSAMGDIEHITNESGSWVRSSPIRFGGYHASLEIDNNDDLHVVHSDGLGNLRLEYTTIQGTGKGLSMVPVFSVSPSLPDGLVLNWKTGTISGTPTEALANTTFTVTVTALGTTTTGTFTLYVTGAPGEIAYSDISGTKGMVITSVTPFITSTGTSGSITSWAINASLPSGLTFETSNGTIWGTPTVVVAGEVFTIWANNSAGSKSTTINITINDVGVTAITYPSENLTLTLYHTMTTATPSTTGGTATTWGISPSLPSGMSFNSATGAISGTPENLQTTAVAYTVWANNSGGDFSDQINITINDYEPVPLNYFGENITLDYNQTMTPLSGFELRPDLMAAGYDHSCAIKDDGTVRCWGEGANGRLGYGGSADKSSPTATSSLGTGRTAVDISAGGDHTCAVLDNGSVACWGGNAFGQLGDGTTSSRTTPTQTLSLGRPAVAVEVGWYFTCALLDNGAVSCWGKNNQGQLGRGYENASTDTHQATPGLTLPMPGGRPVLTMDISHYMACGVVDNGSIACWGQYGGGKTPSLKTFFSDANPAKDVATGRYSACGLMVNGNVTCWGTGFLGTGGSGQTANPGVIWPNLGSGRTAVHVELGRKHNCALLDNDAVKCWGDDSYGQMGNGASTSNENTPTSVSFASGVVVQDIIAGQWHTCIAAQTNEMYCWGDGVRGKLGDGSTSQNNFAGSSAKVNHFSGTNPVKAHGDITSWAVHPALPSGLALGSTNGTLWGTPTASISQTNFTIYGNNSGGSSSFVLNLGVNAQAPGPFEYNPENNTLTNNTEVHLAPQFINQTTGNGSTWQVADIFSGGDSYPGREMAILVGDTMYFDADDYNYGIELWAHDTSNASTWRVTDINSGSGDGSPGHDGLAILVGDTLYFNANDGSSGFELWAHDTSNASTWRVADINSGSGDSDPGDYMSMLVGDTLYFSADDGSSGRELWAHDTSNASTWRVADINSGTDDSISSFRMTILVGDTLYFSAKDGSSGWELWAHDTSNASTWRVADINSGTGHSLPGRYMSILVGDTLYFDAEDGGSSGIELWAHDTSNASTWLVTDIRSGTSNSFPGYQMSMLVGDTLYFDATDGSSRELWAHDTSNSSTWRVTDIRSTGNSNLGKYMDTLVGDTLYFSADDGSSGHELWAHDTSNASTWRVADIYSGTSNSYPGQFMEILVGDTLYFSANDGSSVRELWAHDTSNASTWRVADIYSGTGHSYPGQYMSILVGDTLYFDAEDGGSSGQELWAHRPSTIGYNTNTGGAVTSWAISPALPSGLSFGTSNGTIYGTPTELWTQTSYMVWANNSGGQSVAYLNITVVDELPTLSYSPSTLVLTKDNQSSDLPLSATLTGSGTITSWAISPALPSGLSFGTSNGTIWGIPTVLQTTATTYTVWANNTGGSTSATVTITINDGAPGPFEYNPENNTLTNNTYVHLAPQFINQTTGNGSTWLVADIYNGGGGSYPGREMAILVGDTMYFSAYEHNYGFELWAHDTSNASTWRVTDIRSGPGDSSPGDDGLAMLVGDTLYFSADDGSSGYELWAHDTSNASTWRVADINSGSGDSDPGDYMSMLVGDTIYFSADDGSSGHELWAHDTSNASTWRVADIWSGASNSNPGVEFVMLVGDTLYFSAWDGSSGIELWAHDTSNASTWRVADINSGTGHSLPGRYMSILVGDTLYFDAEDGGSSGRELWAHDTSNASTWLVTDIRSGTGNSHPGSQMSMLVGETLYFDAYDGSSGRELWAHDTSNSSTWRVADINSGTGGSNPGQYMDTLVGDTLYFSADDGSSGHELWAHDTSNASTWRVADIYSGTGSSNPYTFPETLVGDTLYFGAKDGSSIYSELWAHDTSNGSTWEVDDIRNPGGQMSILVGDTLYFNGGSYATQAVGVELRAHRPSTIGYNTNTGGAVTSWAINASLPNGLSFSTTNGSIYGTPTELWTQTSYMVWANNSGGQSVAYLNITVVDELPTLSYSPENLTLTKGQSSTDLPLSATLTGSGTITSWAISPALPSGLSFGTSNGTIWGIPTVLQTTAVTYTIYANNSGGSSVGYVNITVVDELPTLSYSPENLTLTKGQSNTDLPLNATLTGSGTITSWAISPALPSGLSFGTSNGTIWGTPTSLMSLKTFTIWANNSGGSVNATVNITVNDEAPDISYNPDWFVLTNNTAMSPTATPTNAGGAIPSTVIDSTGDVGEYSSIVIDSYGFKHISYFDATNTKLKYATDKSGSWVHTTVNTNTQMGKYTSIAIDSEGYVHISYDYYSMSYNHLMYATDKSGSWVNTIADGSADVGSHTSIAVDSNDAVHISYYDATNTNLKYATCSSSCSSASSWSKVTIESSSGDVGKYNSIAIDSNDTLHISYRDSTNGDLKYATCSSSCTSASSWTRSTIDSDGNVGSRTSIAIDSNGAVHISYYDITNGDLKYATDQSGSWANTTVDSVGTVGKYSSIAIDANDVVHISYYDATNKDLKYASNMQSYIQTGVGNVIKFIDRDTKVGNEGTSIAVDSNGDVHISYYDDINGDLKYAALQGVHPWNVYGYSISPALPAGLSLNFNSGEISGTPTALSTNTTYTITARNTGGTNTTTITIEVLDQLPTLSYSPENLTLTKGQSSTDLPLSATLTGVGTITSWAISPALPSGLSFGTSNGTIWGIATVLQTSPVTYTVWANNSGGSDNATINITINDQAPNISYSPDDLNLTRATASSDLPLSPTNNGGNTQSAALSCSSSDKLFVVADHQGTRHVLCGTTLYSIDLNGTQTMSSNIVTGTTFGLEIDDDGHLHIGHRVDNYPYIEIYHATNKNGSWQSSNVFNFSYGGSVGYDSQGFSMAVGSDDSIHFTYIRVTSAGNSNNLYHLSNQSGSWSSALLTNSGKPSAPSLALNDDNVPHVAFTAGNSFSVGKYESGSYTTLLSRSNYLGPDIVIDAQGDVHVVYRRSGYSLYYSTNASGSWQHTTLDSTERHIDVRIALDSNEYPHVMTASVSGQNNNYRLVNYYSHDGSSWNGGSITSEINLQLPRPDLFVDDNDVISMVYHDGSYANLFTGIGLTTYGYSISPALPSGLHFSQSTGTISGIANVQMNRTMFTITANNSGGSSTAYINITVNDRMPSFTYSPENLTLTNNTVNSDLPLVPTVPYTADAPTDWVLMGTLPVGLNFGTNNGTIWGTPTVVQSITMYQIWGNNSGGSHSVFVNITIYDPVVDLQYNPENLTLTRDDPMTDLMPAYTGIVDDWTIVPNLPSGLSFTNGVISGTPDINMTRTTYTVWANNTGGSSSHTINITILEPMVTLDYNPENMTLVRGTQMSDMVPTVTGGMVEFWSIHPALPSGLLFDNGTVSGTPTVNMTMTMFTVYANNTGGNASHTINLTILEPTGDLSYTNVTLTRNVSMSPLSPTYSGGAVEVWSIHPTLPNGLNFSNGVISGTPLVNMTNSMFTVYANNSGGVASGTVNITILEPAVTLSYNPDNLTLIRGTTMTPLEPTVTGGNVSEWGIMPDLPSGLTFANGVFFGTPDENMTQMQFTVYANTSGGEAMAWVNITVLEPAVNLSYNPYNVTLVRNVSMTPLSPTVSGGSAESWAIEPALPAGLLFDNGTISGTPEVNMTTTMFTVWANTSGGPDSTTVNITIVEPPVSFVYDPAEITLTRNETMNATSPTLLNDAKADQWSISPALPAGMNFSNGVISGTPEVNMTATQFTVYANNSGGSSAAFLTITILEPVATVVYVPENITLIRGEDNASIVPILGGGMVESWSISPALPDGLFFDNGSIFGIPLINSTNMTYVVIATNTGGSAVAYLNITIVEPIAVLAFNESFVLTRGVDELNASVNNTGGMVATWAIEPALPLGITLQQGVLFGVSEVNLTVTTYTLWANNSGGSASLSFTLEVLEPKAEVEYPEDGITLINGISHGLIIPVIEGGVPATWSIEPPLPDGLTFVNGYIIGTPTANLNETVFTVYANNSGGTEITNFTLTVEQPTYISRYPKTLIVLGVNQTLDPLYPLFYFEENRIPVWSITPGLPEGLLFDNGTIYGIPTVPSNFTNYTVTVTGQMVPVKLHVSIVVMGEPDLTIQSVRNETTEEDIFVIPEFEEVDNSFNMFWICPPIFALLAIMLSITLIRLMERTEEDTPEGEENGDGDEESEG